MNSLNQKLELGVSAAESRGHMMSNFQAVDEFRFGLVQVAMCEICLATVTVDVCIVGAPCYFGDAVTEPCDWPDEAYQDFAEVCGESW